jgi:acyl carrier protein
MNNLEIYNEVFVTSFKVSASQLDTLTYQSIAGWDSVGHLVMISSLEEAFNIVIDTEDIIDFLSYDKGKQILKKYSIEV